MSGERGFRGGGIQTGEEGKAMHQHQYFQEGDMRCFARTIMIGLAVLSAMALMVTPQAFAAKASFDSPPGEPPYGLAVHGNAGGTKLYGTIEIELINPDAGFAEARAVVRLRKGNTVEVFYSGLLLDVNYSNPPLYQDAVAQALKTEILNGFFPGESNLCIWLKAASELGVSASYQESGANFRFEMMDVEIAVNTCSAQ